MPIDKNIPFLDRNSFSSNAPAAFADRQKRYLADRNRTFVQKRAHLSSDFFSASVQGLTDDFFAYTNTKIRLADLERSASRIADDIKEFLIPDFSYIALGAKINCMGSVFLVTNPRNISSPMCEGICERCNTAYNDYDEDGNLIAEPIIIRNQSMKENGNTSPQNLMLPNGYFEIACQKNRNTERLFRNKRIVLGDKVYFLTGISDFSREFTFERHSAKLLTFTARLEETTAFDDTENRFLADVSNANGKTVQGEPSPDSVSFLGFIPDAVSLYKKVSLTAAYFDSNRKETHEAISFSFSGADASCYAASVSDDGKMLSVYCQRISETPLTVTACANGKSVSVSLRLEGF
ncbi:MAG: hypothetical protein IJ489_08845 [Clostridia bacterium]|nr:hypothetical protein [Clostridia bacterium]